ncbi:hypothetical protein EV182_001473 [Spiromyces aspiralis]|uniref:Uncharacterized protein n=1 Tax=Spiromyces aspiralis TaxID=68401 RepID=A0ACC1HFV8_9FUNG|nr:hypothetical protein EV182_001473 [Spiromyces aspiralis]
MAIPKRRHEKATETAPTTDDGAAPAKKSRLDDDPKNDPKLPTNTKMPESYDFIEQVPSGYAKIVTWNVNSLAAACNKGFKKYLKAEDPDVICLQETKANQPMAMLIDKKWYPYQYWNCCKSGKKGYGENIYGIGIVVLQANLKELWAQ